MKHSLLRRNEISCPGRIRSTGEVNYAFQNLLFFEEEKNCSRFQLSFILSVDV
jgi:hypothetical protein